MKMIDALKTIYADSDEKIIFTDMNFRVLWTTISDIPNKLPVSSFKISAYDTLELPVTQKTICRFYCSDKCFTVTIKPIYENDKQTGCLMTVLDEHEIDTLAMQSTLKDRLRNDLDAIRFGASSIMNLLNMHNKVWSGEKRDDLTEFDNESREKIVDILAATANYEEMSIYLGETIDSEIKFMSAALDDLAKRISCRAEKMGYSFKCNVKAMVHLEMNTARFEAAVSNLIANAYMYNSKPDKQCTVELDQEGKKIVLSVTDNGDGIAPDILEKLRRPLEYFTFASLSESLGLTVAMLYCHRFGGTLEIDSEEGRYTTVKMIFDDPGQSVPRGFRQYRPPLTFPLDNTSCILGKAFGYFNDSSY